MDFLNKSFTQIKDLFEGMTPGSRILAGLLLAVVVISMGFLVKSGVNAGDTFLFDNSVFDSSQINAMEVAFSSAGLNDWETVGGRIRVPGSERYLYLAALADGEALPQNLDQIIKESIQSISSFASRTLTEAALKDATDRYVGRIIAASPDIKTAYVISSSATPSRSGRLLPTSKATVAVTVTPTGSKKLKREDVQYIFHLVKGAFTEVEFPGISITTTNKRHFQGRDEDDPTFGGGHLAKKREYGRHWENSIKALFPNILGLVVTATVELDPRKSHREDTVTPDQESTVNERLTESESTHESTTGSPGGNPGPTAQGAMSPGRITGVAAGGTQETTTDSETDIAYRIGGSTSSSVFAGLTPKWVTVGITIPDSYAEDVWRTRNPTEADEEPKTPEQTELQAIKTEITTTIKELVEPMLPTGDGVTPAAGNSVTVAFLPSFTPEPLPEPSMVQGAGGWLARSWQTLGMFGLALFSLMMLRSMVRSGQPSAPKPPPTESAKLDESKPDEEETDGKKSLQPFGTSGASLKDELSDLVSDDPDAAANILKNWIGTAAHVK